MNSEAPRIPVNPDHNWYHPQNVLISVVNGIAKAEHWRRQEPDNTGIALKTQRLRDDTDRYAQQQGEIRSLTLGAAVDPDRYQEPLLEAQRAYHIERAGLLGERALALEADRSLFSKLRRRVVETKQTYHRAKGLKAAAGLLRLYDK